MIFKNIDKVKSRIRNYPKDLESWSNKWRLSFAPQKINILIFSRERRPTQIHLEIYGEPIEQALEVRFLGVILN